MAQGALWATLLTAIDPFNTKAMPAVLQSTIELLETELSNAKAALQEIQPLHDPSLIAVGEDDVTTGAMAEYKIRLLQRAASTSDLCLIPGHMSCSGSGRSLAYSGASTRASVESSPTTSLLDILSNSLVLDHLAPYLSVSSLLSVALTSTALHSIVMNTPYVFRYLNLSRCRGAQIPPMDPIDCGGETWRSERMDESLTEDEFYSGPLRGIFANLERRSILQDVRTLVLDGLSVTAELIADILLSDRFNVSVLSIRECLNLNERKLMQTIQYAVRPGRAKGTPRVKGIYYFTPKDISTSEQNHHVQSLGAQAWPNETQSNQNNSRRTTHDRRSCSCQSRDTVQDVVEREKSTPSTSPADAQSGLHEWYRASGRVLKNPISSGWAQTLQLCQGVISFDAVLCCNLRHNADLYVSEDRNLVPPGSFLPPAIATAALGPRGCEGCHTSSEDGLVWTQSPEEHFPLLSPPPLHSYRTTVAKNPAIYPKDNPVLIAQCEECLRGRWCHKCNRWWCASCVPEIGKPTQQTTQSTDKNNGITTKYQKRACVTRDCWECGPTCFTCMTEVLHACVTCGGEYCIEHNDGCSSTRCDWCNTTGRRLTREIY